MCKNVHMTAHDEVAEAVRAARKAQGLQQEDLATAAGVSRRTIASIEAGHARLQLDVLDRVLKALGLQLRIESR